MDPVRVAVRAVFAYVLLLVMMRLSGKRTVAQGSAEEFVMALIFGDLVDDVVWAEVSVFQFTVAVVTLFMSRMLVAVLRVRQLRGTAPLY